MLKITMHVEGLEALKAKLASSGTKIEHAVAKKIANDTEKYLPAKNKVLANNTQEQVNLIIYPGPYARYLHGGKLWIYLPTGSSWAPYAKRKAPTNRDLNISTAVHPKATSHWLEASKAQNLEKWEEFAAKEQLSELKNG